MSSASSFIKTIGCLIILAVIVLFSPLGTILFMVF